MTSVRPIEFIIDPDDPFEQDRLDRQRRVEALCQLILRIESAGVIAVNGRFGSGKSVFLGMCAAHLRKQDVPVAEFNAWQQSHTGVPLVDLVSALRRDPSATQRLWQIAVNLAWRSASVATGGSIEREDFQPPEDFGKFEEWQQTEERRTQFRDALAAMVGESGRLVVLIDELDRCPPARALELLDAVRHLFDVPGVVILLGINEQELRHRVRKLYGQDCEAAEYLRRFVDLMIDLPEPGSELAGFLNEALAAVGLEDRITAGARQYSGWMVQILAERSGMSPRDVQQMAHRVACMLALVPAPGPSRAGPSDSRLAAQHACLSLFALRSSDPDAYRKFVAGESDAFVAAAALVKALSLERAVAADHRTALAMVATLLTMGLGDHIHMDVDEFERRFVGAGIGDAGVAEGIQRQLDRLGLGYYDIPMSHVVDVVELAL